MFFHVFWSSCCFVLFRVLFVFFDIVSCFFRVFNVLNVKCFNASHVFDVFASFFLCAKALMRDDFPTFDRPTIASSRTLLGSWSRREADWRKRIGSGLDIFLD